MRGWLNGVCLVILVALMSYSIPSSVQAQGATTDQYYAAAGKLYAAKNYSQAAQYYYAAVKLNPSHAMAYQGLGNCYYALGRKADALTFYKRASALQPNNAQLAQFVQNLQAQVGGGQAAAPGAGMVAASPMAQGAALFQQKQFAASIPYFQLATQQTPNDYRPFYYAGYAYYMTQDGKDAALYFGVANAKQPSASIKAYADRIKASLSSDDQQWVDDQVAKYTQGGTAVAAGGGKKDDVAFGFHIPVGMEYILADPTQIKQYITNANSVSLTGITPNIIPFPELEPFVRLGNFEINLALGYFPVGNLSYTTYDLAQPNQNGGAAPDVWKYTYNTTIITADLGFKILFGDSKVKGYFGLGGGISPISMTFTKVAYDQTGTNVVKTDAVSTGSYSTMAVNGQAILGVDFYLGKNIAIGPYIGYRYLSATSFQNGGNNLVVDTKNGAVGVQGTASTLGSPNMPIADPTTPLTLDFSGLTGGLGLTFSF